MTNRLVASMLIVLAVAFASQAAALVAADDESATADAKAARQRAGQAAETRFFEMRTYTTHPGRLDALHARFRDHTNRLFKKHGMDLIAYWTPVDGDEAENTLIYVLAYPDEEARAASWKGFRNDPEWKQAFAESTKDKPIVKGVKSVFLTPTDYSPIK